VDREEFASFYAASFPRLVGQLYAMRGDRTEAQDAVQEAFVRAWVHRGHVGVGVRAIAVTPDGKTAYVAAFRVKAGPGTVTPISTATNTALRPVKVSRFPLTIAITAGRRG
jgi:hypothetical protein